MGRTYFEVLHLMRSTGMEVQLDLGTEAVGEVILVQAEVVTRQLTGTSVSAASLTPGG